MLRFALILLLACSCSAVADDYMPEPKPPQEIDWLLYRDGRGIVRLLTADFRRDVWESHWDGPRLTQFAVSVTHRFTRIDTCEYFSEAGARYLRLFQRPDGTVLVKCWNDADPCHVGTVEFPSFDAVLTDPDLSQMLNPVLVYFGQYLPTADELRQRFRGGKCDDATRATVRAILPDLDSTDNRTRRRARQRLEPYRAVLWDGVMDLDLSTGQRAQVAAIAYLPPIRGTVELLEVAAAVFN